MILGIIIGIFIGGCVGIVIMAIMQMAREDVKHLGDIAKIYGAAVEPVEVIIGGSPCQDLSVAGKREGLIV